MFTKTQAKEWALRMVVTSLHKRAETLKTGDLSPQARQKDVAKAQAAMRELADSLEQKRQKLLTRQRVTKEKADEDAGRSDGGSKEGAGT